MILGLILIGCLLLPSVILALAIFQRDIVAMFKRWERRMRNDQVEVEMVDVYLCPWRESPTYEITLCEFDGAKLPSSKHTIVMN